MGHLPFPERYTRFVDLFISPNIVGGSVKRKAIVPDEIFGEHGHSLSEYAQLLWLYKHVDGILVNLQYLNLFQYRRFVSPELSIGVKSVNGPWITTIKESELELYAHCFNRINTTSCFNTPITVSGGVIAQYANTHILDDLLNFTRYLIEIKLFSPIAAASFLRYPNMVPASSVGIYHVDIFKKLFSFLEKAAGFLNSPYFVVRDGYQRRSMGFLLERLHSFLILETAADAGKFGHNIMISETAAVTSTIERINNE